MYTKNNMLKSLNLLSIDEQKDLRQERMFMIVRNIAAIFIGILIFASAALYAAKTIILEESDLLFKQSQAVDDRSKQINEKVGAFNQMLANIEKIQKEDILLDEKILLIAKTIPEKISINSLSIDKETLIFSISGTAPARLDFNELKNKFEQAKKTFKEISTPDISLTARTDIPFTLSGRLIVEGFAPKAKRAAPAQKSNTE